MLRSWSFFPLLLLALLAGSCSYFNKKDLRISLKFFNTGTLGPQEIRDLVNKRIQLAFNLEESAITPGKFSISEYTLTVKGLPGDTGLEKKIVNLFSAGKGLSFWETYRMDEAYSWMYKLNDTLISILRLDTIKDTLYESEIRQKERKYPLLSVIAPAFDPSSQGAYLSAMKMLCRPEDTVQAMRLLKWGFDAKLFPQNLKMVWSIGPEKRMDRLELFFLKGHNGVRPCLEPGQMLAVQKEDDAGMGAYSVSFTMNEKDAKKWKDITASNAPRYGMEGNAIAIVIQDRVVSAPVVQSAIIDGRCQITGDFTERQADDLVNVLKSSPLQFEVKVVDIEEVK